MLEVEVNFKSRAIWEGDVKIGEVAARAALAPSAIRYYEKAGLLKQPLRSNGRRVYSSEILHQLVIIEFAKETGFTLSEIKLLLHGFPEKTPASARWKKMAREKIGQLKSALARTTAMRDMLESMTSCRCRKLEQCAEGLAKHASRWRWSAPRKSREKSDRNRPAQKQIPQAKKLIT
jgi:MerR family transcriptional regulator, redox-sensitive transcriptional activator SoxR